MTEEQKSARSINSVFVAMGSSDGTSETNRNEASKVGRLLAEQEYRLVYGGGEIGLMGLVMFSYVQANKNPDHKVLACITEAFATMSGELDKAETRVELHLHDRVAYMINQAEATIMLPGGTGSIHEGATVLAVADMMRFDGSEDPLQPLILVNPDGYWDPLLMQIAQSCDAGQAYPEKFRMLFVRETAEEAIKLVDQLASKPLITAKALFKGAPVADHWPSSFANQIPEYVEWLRIFKESKPKQLPGLTPRL